MVHIVLSDKLTGILLYLYVTEFWKSPIWVHVNFHVYWVTITSRGELQIYF